MTSIRPETSADIPAIDDLLRDCFGGPGEAALVAALRENGDLALSLVAEDGNQIIGHIAFSPLVVERPATARLYALAPLSVAGPRRREGVGARLVEAGLARLKKSQADGAVVVGDPAYYGRFGFRPELAKGLRCLWSGRYLQALMFRTNAAAPTGALAYAQAFSTLAQGQDL